jgi:hypothetical protein
LAGFAAVLTLTAGCTISAEQIRATDDATFAAPAAGEAAPPANSPTPANTTPNNANPPATDTVAKRRVIYSAFFRVVVADLPGSLAAIRQSAERFGGYLQEISGSSITVRVPAARFDDAVQMIEQAGEVVERQVRAQDVTEDLLDLGVRLDNAEKLRKRLQDILARTEKVEDALKVEAELARVSAELDQLKGKIRFLESHVAMSTLRVDLNTPVRTNLRGNGPRLPFEWVEGVGDGLVAGELQQATRKAGFFSRGPRFKPPAGYVRYYENVGTVDAMDGNGQFLRIRREANVDDAPAAFWSKLVRKTLVESRAVAITHEEGDPNYYLARGTRDVGGKSLGYVLVLKRSRTGVAVFEAWGPRENVAAQWELLRASGLSVDPD